jgi:chaperone modulatory protein CbpM
MITIELLVTQFPGLERQDLERWIGNAWVRPDGGPGGYQFHDIDVARVRLIHELHSDMRINDDALPIVLSLLDQLYDLRRRMRDLSNALDHPAHQELRSGLVAHLMKAVP